MVTAPPAAVHPTIRRLRSEQRIFLDDIRELSLTVIRTTNNVCAQVYFSNILEFPHASTKSCNIRRWAWSISIPPGLNDSSSSCRALNTILQLARHTNIIYIQ